MSDIGRLRTVIYQLKNAATLMGNAFNGNNQLVKVLPNGKLPPLDGSNLTGVIGVPSSISYVAQEDISIYEVVTSDGRVANSALVSQRNKIIGIANVSRLNGFTGTVIGSGEITNISWSWVIGDRIYLNGTTLSTTPPATGYLQFIGTATGSDKIDVKISESILL